MTLFAQNDPDTKQAIAANKLKTKIIYYCREN